MSISQNNSTESTNSQKNSQNLEPTQKIQNKDSKEIDNQVSKKLEIINTTSEQNSEQNLKPEYDFVFLANMYLDPNGEYFSGGAEIHLKNICQTLQIPQNSPNQKSQNSENSDNGINSRINSDSVSNLVISKSDSKSDSKVKILIIQQSAKDSLTEKDGVDVLQIKTKNHWVFRWKLAQILQKIKTKRVHFNYIGLETFVQKKSGTTYSTTFHGTCWDFPTNEFPQKYIPNSIKQKLGSKFVKWNYIREQRKALHWFDQILSVDTGLRRFAQMFLYEKSSKVEVVYNFVDLEKFHPGPDFQAEKFTILYPRNISFARGVHLLVPMANYLKNQGINFVIKMVGAGFGGSSMSKYEQVLHQEIKENSLENCFDFVGRIPHEKMPELFQNCHLAIVPTYYYEGTSLSCLEAMASGKPVVVTNIGGLSDLVIDKHNGFISSPEAIAIAKNIQYVYQNYDKMGEITQTALKIVTQNNSLISWQQKVNKFFGEK